MQVAALVVAVALLACGRGDPAGRLEERLLAPCCWRESVRTHQSGIADELRTEIETRLARGESSDAIEASIVARYGERVRALPAGDDPRWAVGLGPLLAALFVLVVLARRVRRRIAATMPVVGAPVDETWNDRLDAELDGID